MLGGGDVAMNKTDKSLVPACPRSVFWGIPGRQTLVITMMVMFGIE